MKNQVFFIELNVQINYKNHIAGLKLTLKDVNLKF